jgi:Transglycosylase-like domain
MHRQSSQRLTPAVALALLAAIAVAWAVTASPAGGQDANQLQNSIDNSRQHEQSLSGAAARLGRLERGAARAVGILEQRVAAVQADLTQAETMLAQTRARRFAAQQRALRLRKRLKQSRRQLSKLLRQRYTTGKPDLVTVILTSDGFAQLLETVDFIKRIQKQNERILGTVRSARHEAIDQRRVLAKLALQRRAAAEIVKRRHDALANIAAGLEARRSALAQARSARLAALSSSRSKRRHAQKTLNKLLAAQNSYSSSAGPGGPWSIPWAIVQCESGGQNLPPNSAGASGYYQFLPSTWKGLGGSTPNAYQASKAEQDRLAAKLWNGGKGAGNWVCAGIVGIS